MSKNHDQLHPSPQSSRLVSRTGQFNVARRVRHPSFKDFYHSMMTLPWKDFLLWIASAYLLINLCFAVLYTIMGASELEGIAHTGSARFWDCFFFSVQTFATIGYGVIHPVGRMANLLVTLESLSSLLSVGLVTGLMFARFSRPTARVVFSNRALIALHDGIPSLIFRMGNARFNQILEARVSVTVARFEKTAEGESYRTFYDLKLERSVSPIFVLTWTVVHPIDEESPLYGMTQEKMLETETEIVVSVVGIDDTFSQTIYSRYSYTVKEVEWGRKFKDILSRAEDGRVLVNLDGIHELRD